MQLLRLRAVLSILECEGALRAALTWPKFSVTSFTMVSNLVRQGLRPKTVIDVGANVGQFAVASVKLFPDVFVHSFEPNPGCWDALGRNVNPLGNTSISPIALGAENGEVSFHVNSHSHSSSILPLAESHLRAFPDAKMERTIRVEMSTLDTVFRNVVLPSPILLKLDVQGYETQVLRGAVEFLKQVDYVVLEASFKLMYEGEILFMEIVRLMEGYKYSFQRPVGFLNDPLTGEIIQMDALFKRDAGD